MPKVASFPSVTKPPGASSASSFDIILERCHDLISERVSEALARMFNEADEALNAFGSLSRDPETSELYEATRKKVHSQREDIVTWFRMHFLREFQERVNRVKKIGEKFVDVDLPSLEPVAEDDPNETLKFDAMASRLRHYCEEELLALDQRIGVLVGDADLQSEDNPFAPQAIIDAYKHTCRQTDSYVNVRMVLLKLFDDYVLDEIRGMYKAVSALLIKNSILPKIRFSAERGTKAPSGDKKPGNVSVAPVTDNIQQEVKHTDRRGTNRMDAMTLDIMAMLFDDLFDDPEISTAVKGLIGRLQTPMLKLVISDKSFFSKKSHPARQMLDKLSELAVDLPADIDGSEPIYGKLESIVQSFIEGFKDDIKIFDGLHQKLDALSVEVSERAKQETQSLEVNERATQETQSVAGPVDPEQKIALAKTVAQAQVTACLRASAAPQPIVEFLTHHWVRLLVVIHVREGEDSEAWKNALKTVNLILWIGEHKETAEDRRKVIAVLPHLLKSLTDGLSYAGIDDEVRVQFFAYLRKSHTAIFTRPAQPSVVAPSKEPVIEEDSEEAAMDVASGMPETVEENKASDTILEFEATQILGKPDEADTNTDTYASEEMQLDFPPSMGEPDAIPELTDAVTAKSETPSAKSPFSSALPTTLEQDSVPEFTGSTTRVCDAPSAQLRAELDKVMDATRTMFSDIDRFIMLGQYQDAISVLDARIKNEPDARASWITLMAIYRDTDMKDDFYRTYAKFKARYGESPDS